MPVPTYYPPENGNNPFFEFERWYQDVQQGHLVPEYYITRDIDGRLVDRRDLGELDGDWQRRMYRIRTEYFDPEP